MKLLHSAEKLDNYRKRLKSGNAAKIKTRHVERILGKLESKKKKVTKERAEANRPEKKQRLKRKLANIDQQIERANWLKEKIQTSTD